MNAKYDPNQPINLVFKQIEPGVEYTAIANVLHSTSKQITLQIACNNVIWFNYECDSFSYVIL